MCSATQLKRYVTTLEKIHLLALKATTALSELSGDEGVQPRGGWSRISTPIAWTDHIELEAGILLREMQEALRLTQEKTKGASHV